ncbi:MAG TPA: hypothetical protein VK771_10875 [Acidimicrobiia bacterium]|jgi:hypothetical protein|nr:hypothetical protein [Acidimicrobiia bacterium]
MLQAFVFENVAVLVGLWDEPADPPEQGTRIEVRLTGLEPHRGSLSAAQRVVIDQPVFRADLFDRMDSPPGNLLSAHFHPTFDGVEPCDRVWRDEIRHDPTGWLAGELGDLERLLRRAGATVNDGASVARDAHALRAAIPAIVAAVTAAEDARRAST